MNFNIRNENEVNIMKTSNATAAVFAAGMTLYGMGIMKDFGGEKHIEAAYAAKMHAAMPKTNELYEMERKLNTSLELRLGEFRAHSEKIRTLEREADSLFDAYETLKNTPALTEEAKEQQSLEKEKQAALKNKNDMSGFYETLGISTIFASVVLKYRKNDEKETTEKQSTGGTS